jgi:hypothetical protein
MSCRHVIDMPRAARFASNSSACLRYRPKSSDATGFGVVGRLDFGVEAALFAGVGKHHVVETFDRLHGV